MNRRADRALQRQLVYQRAKAAAILRNRRVIELERTEYARSVKARVEKYRALDATTRVLEVGSGAHGLVFFMGLPNAIGVDPLAAEYTALFPYWQSRVKTVSAFGEALPFPDESFDIVFSDNVVDHAERPDLIVQEIARVLAPGGIVYFTVNVHHRVYGLASRLHALTQRLGPRYEIAAFADHTVHFTPREACRLFDSQRWVMLHEESDIDEARANARRERPRHAGDLLKRVFFKNARLEIIARKR
jgi:SAM-dependent methyltransferase